MNPMALGLQVQLGPWECFCGSSPASHALSFTRVDGGGDGEGDFTTPFYLWRSTTFDISMSYAAFRHCLETDFLISKKGKSLVMMVAGSLPPWVMQLGRNRKKNHIASQKHKQKSHLYCWIHVSRGKNIPAP